MTAKQSVGIVMVAFGAVLILWSGYHLAADFLTWPWPPGRPYQWNTTNIQVGKCLAADEHGNFVTVECPRPTL